MSSATENLPAVSQTLDLAQSPAHLIHTLRQVSDEVLSKRLKATGLTPRQFTLLHVISLKPGLSQSEAGTAAGSDRSTIAELTKRMEASGYLSRSRSSVDSRTAVLHLTKSGQWRLDSAIPAVIAANDEIMEALGEAERDAFLNALVTLTSRDTSDGSAH